MPIVIPAEGTVLERVLQTAHSAAPDGLSRQGYARFAAAQRTTAWGSRHQRRFALVDGADVLAGAAQYDLAAVLDRRPVRVCGIGSIFSEPAHRDGGHAWELVERLLGEAARDGAAIALVFSEVRHECQPAGFEVVSMTDVELSVTQSRRGAPMTLIRSGDERDVAAIVSMGRGRLPPGLVPPQVAIESKPSTHVMMVRALGRTIVQPQLSANDVLYWSGDIF